MCRKLLFAVVLALKFNPAFGATNNQPSEIVFSKALPPSVQIEVTKRQIPIPQYSKKDLKRLLSEHKKPLIEDAYRNNFYVKIGDRRQKIWSKDSFITIIANMPQGVRVLDADLKKQTVLILLKDGCRNYVQPIGIENMTNSVLQAAQEIISDTGVGGSARIVISGKFLASTNEVPDVELVYEIVNGLHKKALWHYTNGKWMEVFEPK